jgi:small subunit ribosomal protein S20
MIELSGINVQSIQRRYEMPNIKSAKKRVLVTAKKTARNKSVKSEVKTEIKKFLTLVESGDKKAATAIFPHTCSVIDSAVSKGILKKNTAANKKSGLAKKLNAMA